MQVFDLGSMPVAGGTAGLLAAAAVVCPEIAIYLPRNCNHDHVRAFTALTVDGYTGLNGGFRVCVHVPADSSSTSAMPLSRDD